MASSDPKPPSASDVAEASFKAALQYLPGIFDLTNKAILPNERAQLAATQEVEPKYAQIQKDIFEGSGSGLIDSLIAKEKQVSPEFFETRKAGSDALVKLLSSIDLTGMLSGSESAEIERNLNRMEGGEVSSPQKTIKAAMEFGGASQAKKSQQQQIGTGALGVASGFLPSTRTPIDLLQVATGRPSFAPNIGADTRAGVQNFLGSSNEATGNQAILNAQRRSGVEKSIGMLPDYS